MMVDGWRGITRHDGEYLNTPTSVILRWRVSIDAYIHDTLQGLNVGPSGEFMPAPGFDPPPDAVAILEQERDGWIKDFRELSHRASRLQGELDAANAKLAKFDDRMSKIADNIMLVVGCVEFCYFETQNGARGECAELIRDHIEPLIDLGCFPEIRKITSPVLPPKGSD